MTGYKTAELTVKITEARIGQKYRCVITDAAGNKVTSDEVRLLKPTKDIALRYKVSGANENFINLMKRVAK